MLRLRRLSVTARPFGRNYGKFLEKKTLPMALRITSKDYENLYVTSYFSFHGDKNTLYVNSSKKYRPTSGKLCRLLENYAREKKTFHPRKFFDFYPRNPHFNPRKKIILRLRKRPSARENLCKSGREK